VSVKIQVLFYSMYGHIYRMSEAVVEGAREVEGAEVSLYQVAELVPEEALERVGAKAARSAFEHVPIATPGQLAEADAIIFGTPTRFGNMCAQMRNFLDQTGQLWLSGALVGKVGSVFTSTATQHGGQETTITSLHSTLLHHGAVIVGVPYSETRLLNMAEITGGSPYGAGTLAGGDGNAAEQEVLVVGPRLLAEHLCVLPFQLGQRHGANASISFRTVVSKAFSFLGAVNLVSMRA
jgi:NAD(P)H dehydrogenase (quinone)